MLDVLFRGERVDNGAWVEGFYCHFKDVGKGRETHRIYDRFSETDCDDFYPDWYEVEPESVGQYTGRDDEKGVRIFEGHIISFKRTNALGWTTSRRGVVKYDEESTMFYVLANTGDAWGWYEISDVQVIGNIFDNPELMEGGT